MRKFRNTICLGSRQLCRDDRGVTLPELIVTMMLLSMLLAMIMTIFVAFTRSFADDRLAANNTASATVAMDELTRVIRAGTKNEVAGSATLAPVFSDAGADKVTLQAYIDTNATLPRPTRVEFSLTPENTIVEKRWNAIVGTGGYFSFGGAPNSQRVIARNISAGSTPVFTFLDKASTEIELVGGKVPGARLGAIAAVQISITVQGDQSGGSQSATLQNSVGIPNLNVSRIGPTR